MIPPPSSVLVVGAGLAATQVVSALRDTGFGGRVVVLGAEGVPPYDRPPLSKHLLDRTTPAWLADEVGTDLLTQADEVHLASPARGLQVDDDGATVLTEHGAHRADVVVVATGAHAVRPAAWRAARTLHTAQDADALRAALRPGDRLAVVGAGWIGAEVAGVAARAGVDVTVVEAGPAPLAGALGASVGA
ncbi:FAD-dependent oxidoreductase [Cellulomonas sp.]|uniref:FAD-dependent oxidoreductase n=1 Tax=Cellulomonas sp. TaxID=40001 RepID=UPI0025828909|nr:FAD-dependent oxidoreductase [Cellulomonas sp.]MCR6690694.1 NAD(P)/FAD-dependent oxidoreductase [Cellulomonas sp.]